MSVVSSVQAIDPSYGVDIEKLKMRLEQKCQVATIQFTCQVVACEKHASLQVHPSNYKLK